MAARKTKTKAILNPKSKNKPYILDENIDGYSSLSDEETRLSTTSRLEDNIPSRIRNVRGIKPEDPCHGRPQRRFQRRKSRRQAIGRSRRRQTKKPAFRSRSRKRS